MLARSLPTMLRATASGRGGTVTVSAMVTVQDEPSASTLVRRGRDRLQAHDRFAFGAARDGC